MPSQFGTQEFYSLRELSDMGLGAVDTLRRYIKAGKLPHHNFNNEYKVSKADLDAYLAAHHCPTPEAFNNFVDSVVAVAPALSTEQRSRIVSLLGGAAA